MKLGIAAVGLAVVVGMMAIGCGGAPKTGALAPANEADAGGANASAASTNANAASTNAPGDANGASATNAANPTSAPSDANAAPDAETTAPGEKPFAHNAEEATSFIDDAITSRSNQLVTCVNDDRTRKKDAHAKIVIEVGIDEEGHLLGVKLPKGAKKDKALVDCVLDALRGAPFPRSHAGVITVRRTFEDKAVYR